jgi:hypothetical protein
VNTLSIDAEGCFKSHVVRPSTPFEVR